MASKRMGWVFLLWSLSLAAAPNETNSINSEIPTGPRNLYLSVSGPNVQQINFGVLDYRLDVYTVNEAWIGLPPNRGSSYNSPIPAGPGNPGFWNTLKEKGFYARGLSIVDAYPGGVRQYFSDFVATGIRTHAYEALLRTPSQTISPELDQKLASFSGLIILDIETVLPGINTRYLQVAGTHENKWLTYCQTSLGITSQNECVTRYNLLASRLYLMMLSEYRSLFPKAKIGWYAIPQGGTHDVWQTSQSSIPEQNYHRYTISWLIPLLDFISPVFYQYYAISDGDSPPYSPGEVSYIEFIKARGAYADECRELSKLYNKPVIAYVMPVYAPSAASQAFKGLSKASWRVTIDLALRSNASALVIWASTQLGGPTAAEEISRGFENGYELLGAFAEQAFSK